MCALVVFVCRVAGLAPATARGEEFGGFGLVVAQLFDGDAAGHMGEIVVLHVPRESGAYKAGIRAGDVIVEVDGVKTAGNAFGDIVLNRLRGKVGSSSNLKVRRAPEGTILAFDVVRTRITYAPPGPSE
jgi:carboxyl-terminal processing protease